MGFPPRHIPPPCRSPSKGATEQPIQQKIELGQFRYPAEVIARALDSLDSEESWTDEERSHLDQHLAASMAQIERGEGIPGDRVREVLAQLSQHR